MILFFFSGNVGVNNKDQFIEITPYEYIADHTPERLKLLFDKFYKKALFSEKMIDFYAPVSADNELCRNESRLYKESFQKFDVWALKSKFRFFYFFIL